MEQLSGIDLTKVRIHNDSGKPAAHNAVALTRGQNIHISPGQEKYLPHETWHAVQQIQGRVRPTCYSSGIPINDDANLEREADAMSAWASLPHRATRKYAASAHHTPAHLPSNTQVVQRQVGPSDTSSGMSNESIGAKATTDLQRQLTYAMTVLTRARLTETEEDRFGVLIPGSRVYELIRRRRRVRDDIRTAEHSIDYYETTNAAIEALLPGEQLDAGVGADENLFSSLQSDIEDLSGQASQLTSDIDAQLAALGIPSESALARMVEIEFPRMWIARANAIALGMLSVNRERVIEEQERYASEFCAIDTAELQAADDEIHSLWNRVHERASTFRRIEEVQKGGAVGAAERLEAAQRLARDAGRNPEVFLAGLVPARMNCNCSRKS